MHFDVTGYIPSQMSFMKIGSLFCLKINADPMDRSHKIYSTSSIVSKFNSQVSPLCKKCKFPTASYTVFIVFRPCL